MTMSFNHFILRRLLYVAAIRKPQDRTANMSGKYNGFATNSQEKSPKAIKSGPLQQLLGARIIFYVRFNEATFSLLSRRLEQAVATVNEGKPKEHIITISTISVKPDG